MNFSSRTYVFFLLCLLCSLPAFSQLLPNAYFQNPTQIACPWDTSGQTLNYAFQEWRGFQTLDSTHWGPRDTNCFDISSFTGNGLRIAFDDLDTTIPIYIVSQLDSANKVPLDSNTLYRFSANFQAAQNAQLMDGITCPEDVCTGMQIGIEIPDSMGTGTDIRWYKGYSQYGVQGFFSFEFCIPTEKFPNGNHIRRAWLKIQPNGPNTNETLRCTGTYIENMQWATENLYAIEAPWNGFQYEFDMSPWNQACLGMTNFVLAYGDTTYPNPNDISWVDVMPSPNTTTQEHVQVTVDPMGFLIAQPFTQMRGGPVLNDTLRHTYTLTNNGGTVCTYGIVEFVFQGGDGYRHNAGNVDFGSKNSCMLFGKGGKLIVPDGVTFEYGRAGMGMLALRTGGIIELGQGSELHLHNQFVFGEYRDENKPQSFDIYLKPGARLTFGAGSSLSNRLSKFPDATFLNVHMQGGVLDDSHLSKRERALIRRIYDDAPESGPPVHVFGNPFHDVLTYTYGAERKTQLTTQLYTASGKLVYTQSRVTGVGNQRHDIQTAALAPGIYLLRIVTADAVITRKVVKQ